MLHFDYNWDLHPDRIILDEELNIDRLGWKHGDHFMVTNHNGRAMLVKVDPVVAFSKGYKVNFGEDNGCSRTS
jgi:hypothetical protein